MEKTSNANAWQRSTLALNDIEKSIGLKMLQVHPKNYTSPQITNNNSTAHQLYHKQKRVIIKTFGKSKGKKCKIKGKLVLNTTKKNSNSKNN